MPSAVRSWELTKTDPELSRKVDDALRTVVDPELGLNLMELGLVRSLHKDGETLHMNMILTTPFCPYGPMLVDEVRHAVEDAVEMVVELEIGTEVWDAHMMEDELAAEWGLL